MASKSSIDYEEIAKKYQQMVKSRKESGDININDYLPNIYEMMKEDCVWNVLESMQKEISKSKDKKEDIAYYVETPPITAPGYYENEQVFVLHGNKNCFYNKTGCWDLGDMDGDTWTLKLDELSVGNPFTINGRKYETYKDYAIDHNIGCANIQVRSIAINTSEICHYMAIIVPKSEARIETVNYDTAILRGYAVAPHKINRNKSKDPNKWTITNYKNDDKLKFMVYNDSFYQIADEFNAADYLTDVDYDKKNNYAYIVVGSAEWGSETVRDGYKAQYRAREIIENANIKDVIVMLDRNTITGQRIDTERIKYYNSFLFTLQNIKTFAYDMFKRDVMNFSLATAEFLPFGCDKYGRTLGNIWVKIGTKDGDMWINLSKYVTAGSDFTEINPQFYSTEMAEIYGGASDAFKQWNYIDDKFKYVDSMTSDGTKSYLDRIKLHKELTGIDFAVARDHTVLLGDTLFLIPPEAIHTSSTLDYEKLPIIRGKGSMMKNRTNIEELLELELYFNNEYGINGIPYKTTTPNGTEVTYFMNGLRALIAQFRVAPFLPIENHYINDVLNIEAVSLVNINVSTVEGFPRLLKVVLTLRDFNYRVFMPDLPLPDYDAESSEISEMQHIFAKHFDWELFRYYYQRGLINGDQLNTYTYNTYNYNDFLYSNKNVYKAADLTDSNFELYVPDVSWLKYALQVKKARDQYGQVDFDGLDAETEKADSGSVNDFIIEMNGNKAKFSKSELNPEARESYSDLDGLGRCGPAFAVLNSSLMPSGERNIDISGVTPSGWKNKRYDALVSEGNTQGYLYNRSHLIGYQLTGQGANEKNLITGTRYLNAGTYEKNNDDPKYGGMVYYENKVAAYLKKNPSNHVAYRVTPIFDGSNLVASAVQIEAYSIEDKGKLQFNVYIRNIQPGIAIDYATGENRMATYDTEEIVYNYYNYKDPRNMKFVPFLQDEYGKSVPIELDGISFNMANYFTETHLKAVDGFAPQYMGGSDVSIELNMTITNEYYVGALKNLPHTILDMIRNYRRVMPCFPLKIKNEYLQMIGVNEVVFDNISVSTMPGQPGVYSVVIKLTSMDRSMRQREALQKANTGTMTSTDATNTIGDYFELQDTLAAAELYPDLDLPTIDELSELGWKYAKWANEKRMYVDPDFYMCYSFQYASRLIKEVINNVLYRVSFSAGRAETEAIESGRDLTTAEKKQKSNAKDLNKVNLMDDSGIYMEVSAGIGYDGIDVDKQKGFANQYDQVMIDIQNKANSDNTKKKKGKKNYPTKDQIKSISSALEYLTASGIENGWQIAPGWYAPLCDTYVNDELESFRYSGISKTKESEKQNNEFLSSVYDLRHRAIMLIDRVLDKPLISDHDKSDNALDCVYDAVKNLLGDGNGKQLVELLCPMQYQYEFTENKVEASKQNHTKLDLKPEFFEYADPYRWIQGYLYALACARSGSEPYSEGKKGCNWQAQQWQNKRYDTNDKAAGKQGYRDFVIPYNKIRQGRGNAGDNMLADTYESWAEDGVSFGAGQITIYNKSEIRNMMQPESKIKYFNYGYKGGASEYYNNMYHKTKRAGRKRFCETGFIDTYYNYAGYKSAEGKDYIHRISVSQTANYEALLREVLVYLKRLIMDGYIFSEIDVVAEDWDGALAEITKQGAAYGGQSTANSGANYFVNSYRNDMLAAAYDTNGDDTDEEVDEGTKQANKIQNLKEEISESYNKLFCSRLIYPFALASCNGNKNVLNFFKDRDYQTLSTYTLASTIGGSNNSQFNTFLNAMYGVGMIGSCNALDSAETTSNTQKAFNTLMAEAFTAMADDPRCYALHSMYDMCVTDKRGRLLRAFPCYYILFVDEGRMLGTWKLFDNFYNMSSISNLQVVKSRKMPSDTCTFTMSNMFMSYADTYDNTIYQQYVDVYGLKDTFLGIFSPRAAVTKEDAIRKRKQLTDTAVISPGVRIHVRMGYGSDGSRLPIVFNGKIAEVNCGETVDIVAQGDGHELNNPLNTLGELTAINLDEAQSWCTLFKDIRGSLARGGQTPRNLLAKLSTAQYGGAFKSIVREYTQGRFFYDNPFGIYHFGDKRFKDIFEDSEIVQNMYEVSNKTMLNGVNDLLDDMSTVNAAPIINCNIQDKTMWEIGHLCANSGDDFYFAVRDFGLRSTMCLCKANHYYAYQYEQVKENDAIVEKRKPFQQWHYYDSYNDIIYNSLKASETNMKTNAVGTWEGTDILWGTAQQSVGPIYLDMNIYPEYQKSMTVETGLVAGGDGGIDIPIFNHLAEKFNYDEYQGRVSKSLAEKVTTNVLRQSVKDMYEGEICIIGDTSLKPYDRACLMDVYEDMSGDVEIETVIHSMNIETGFTTTFIPDVIVRAENSAQECGYQSVLSGVILGLGGSITLKGTVMAAAKKGVSGLIKLGVGEGIKKAGQAAINSATQTALGAFLSSFGTEAIKDIGIGALLTNPVGLASTVIAGASIFMLTQNAKEMFYRWCRNIQALTVFPITKNGRLLIAGMAGHKGSVYGYKYSDSAKENSLQNYIMKFTDWGTDHTGLNVVGWIFKSILCDDNYEKVKNKWINNLGLEKSNDIINGRAGDLRNIEAFNQFLGNSITKEYTSRAASLAAMKTKPRITSFNTSNRTSDVYMKYQIGGVHDKTDIKQDENTKPLTVKDLSTNERIKALIPLEDDPDIKLALTSDVHPVIKQFIFYHSTSPLTFNLKMENEDTIIRYFADGKGETKIFDLPMLQEDAVLLIKLIINSDNLKGKTVTFLSGTRVNSTSSWKSTGFWFSLSCDDMTALEAASAEIKKDSSWVNSKLSSFAYKRTANSIQYTVYAPIEITGNTIYDAVGDDEDE